MSDTIAEIRQKRTMLEFDLTALVAAFEQETGQKVDELSITHMDDESWTNGPYIKTWPVIKVVIRL